MRKSKRFITLASGLLMLAGTLHAALITDDFNRATTVVQTPDSDPNLIGTNYTITSGEWRINAAGDGLQANVNPSRMYENTLQTLNEGEYSFVLSADVMVLNGSGRNGGIMCNFQDDLNYYVLRYFVVDGTATAGFVKVVNGSASFIGDGSQQSTAIAAGTFHTLTISSADNTFNWSIGTVGGPAILTGSVTDTTFTGGYSGFYRVGGGNVTFDNYSLEVIPEPATLGLLGIATAGILLFRRLKKA